MKVFVSKSVWAGFLKRAKKAYPKEHIEAIWGEETIEGFRIQKFAPIEYTSEKDSIYYEEFEYRKQKWEAKQEGLTYIGSCHSHPSKEYDSCPSSTDHKEGFRIGERLMGILVLHKEKNRFHVTTEWWFPQPTLDFVILDE